jgi:hypothetical protein
MRKTFQKNYPLKDFLIGTSRVFSSSFSCCFYLKSRLKRGWKKRWTFESLWKNNNNKRHSNLTQRRMNNMKSIRLQFKISFFQFNYSLFCQGNNLFLYLYHSHRQHLFKLDYEIFLGLPLCLDICLPEHSSKQQQKNIEEL